MIGNDIVDLYLAEKESCCHRKGFLEKIFTPAEISRIEQAASPVVMLWLLWSCKEAAYKIVHRATRMRSYAPHKFTCHHLNISGSHAEGVVVYQQQYFYFRSHCTGSCIHTQAAIYPALLEQMAVFTLYHHQPDYRWMMREQHILEQEELLVKDKHGIPFIRNSYKQTDMLVSVSHHGKYLGLVKSDC